MAVIMQALEDVTFDEQKWLDKGPDSRKAKAEKREARHWAASWFFSEDKYPNSFLRICAHLDLPAQVLRDAIKSGRAHAIMPVWVAACEIARRIEALVTQGDATSIRQYLRQERRRRPGDDLWSCAWFMVGLQSKQDLCDMDVDFSFGR